MCGHLRNSIVLGLAVHAQRCTPVAFRFRTYGIVLTDRSQEYVDKLLNHPAMLEWEQDALNETMRDQSHEIEIEQRGLIVQDLRASPKVSL